MDPELNGPAYELSTLDFQLLLELRIGVVERKPLAVTTLRILCARGWVDLPLSDEWYSYEVPEGEDGALDTVSHQDADFAQIRLTPVGCRELAAFSRHFDDDELYSIIEEDEGVDLEDEPCEDE